MVEANIAEMSYGDEQQRTDEQGTTGYGSGFLRCLYGLWDGSYEAKGPKREHRQDSKASSRRLLILRDDLRKHPNTVPDWMVKFGVTVADIERVCTSMENLHTGQYHANIEFLGDGVGGSAFGDKASEYASMFFLFRFHDLIDQKRYKIDGNEQLYKEQIESIHQAIIDTNEKVKTIKSEDGLKKGQSTFVLDLNTVFGHVVFWSGDSRIRHIKSGQQVWENKPHTYVQGLVDKKVITPQEAASHPQRNVITASLGEEIIKYEWALIGKLGPRDRLVLHSDGIRQDAQNIARVVDQLLPPEAARKLGRDSINPSVNTDNVSVRVIADMLPYYQDQRGNIFPDYRRGDNCHILLPNGQHITFRPIKFDGLGAKIRRFLGEPLDIPNKPCLTINSQSWSWLDKHRRIQVGNQIYSLEANRKTWYLQRVQQ